jgi:large subunit ribosomal protein L17
MRHLKSGRKLNRTASHRKAMLANLSTSILDKERVVTTVAKAKEVRGVVERLITHAKRGTLNSIRLASKTVKDKTVLKKLFDDIAPGYSERAGGYTRIVKIGTRKGDNAELSLIELVGRNEPEGTRRKKKKSTAKKGSKSVKKKIPPAAAGEVKKEKTEAEAAEPHVDRTDSETAPAAEAPATQEVKKKSGAENEIESKEETPDTSSPDSESENTPPEPQNSENDTKDE